MKRFTAEYFATSPATFPRMVRAWNSFWFTPGDPTVLGLIRLTCGLITLYTLFIYSFSLQEFMGAQAWYDLQLRMEIVRNKPSIADPLDGMTSVFLPPRDDWERQYYNEYRDKFGIDPPAPFPKNRAQAAEIDEYKKMHGYDLRMFGLPPPETEEQREYLRRYTEKWNIPPPAYPRFARQGDEVESEEEQIDKYMATHGPYDPRRLHARGVPNWSLWFHVTDPTAMAIIHGVVVFVAFLFTIGFCTRVTTALTWMASLWYIHRNTVVLFGVDTMMVILLFYLMIGPSGAAYSVDRLIARWWSKHKLGVINRWRSFWGKTSLTADQIVPAIFSEKPQPSIGANFAIRLLQIHVCTIYIIAGLSKLQGQAWWNGTALWGTLANYEFAPMQFEIYNEALRFLGRKQWMFELFLTAGGLFTLAFEISYPFLVWRPSTRWLILSGAILLHGFIGLFMGLKTFSLMMLVMNMAFVRPEEVRRVVSGLWWFVGSPAPAPVAAAKPRPRFEPAPARTTTTAAVGSSHIKEKKK